MVTKRPAIDAFVTIDRSVDQVWTVLADWRVAGEWLPGVTDCDGPAAMLAGDEVTFQYRGVPSTAVVSVSDDPNRLVLRRVNGPVSAVFDYALEPTHVGTKVRLLADIETESLVRLARRPLRRALATTDHDQLLRLKAHVESA